VNTVIVKSVVVPSLVLFAQLMATAQAAECKYDRIYVHETTNEKIVHTEKRMLTDRVEGFVGRVFGGKSSEVLVRGISYGEKDYISIEIRLRRTYASPPDSDDLSDALTVRENAKLMILMDDDSIVKLDAVREYKGKAKPWSNEDGSYDVDVNIAAAYRLDDETARSLTSGEAMVIRVEVDSGRLGLSGRNSNINFGTNSKSKSFFNDVVLCLQQEHAAEAA